ncbi:MULTISPECIES: TIGR03792 family protein [unclassified Coleofasciculus]|uniref:TIGR03792 family protein n=1 Tax=unclassified Coleofasciculus TaxID=2692782 RepID=UPI00188025A1|nr:MULTISPECIES: TIGR03792 family protein [unclassified Coleofasciculus]MBE9126622.1 TIGR03792 family protein [Coleofasciculus sp. LEGE 07081]MBE9148874.1 TIGR03792 family protein [Coleofasciculus sp. LEGE 07092]
MVIEWLKIRVSPELRENFIQKDSEIWNSMLASCPGFVSKEVWIDPGVPGELVLVIRWASREQWKSISLERLTKVEQQFDREFGESYQMIETTEYQIRKFPQVSS